MGVRATPSNLTMAIDLTKYEGHTEGPWRVEGELTEGDDNIGQSGDSTLSIHGDGLYIGEIGADYGIHETIANAQLMADAPLLLEEVKRLREQLGQARECLWWCYDNERFGWDIDEQSWEVIGRLLGADTDHNDNEWKEEEE